MRIAILWQRLSGYFNACLSVLAEQGAETTVAWRDPNPDAPFRLLPPSGVAHGPHFAEQPDPAALLRHLEAFRPDCLVVNSWHVAAYRTALRRFAGRCPRVLCMDNQWLATPKQWLGVLSSPWAIRPLYDRVFLPGERQAVFARRLGFQDRDIATGLYSCDRDLFGGVYRKRKAGGGGEGRFLFVGRLIPEKGADLLAPAFRRFREACPDGPGLTVCGKGPLAETVAGPGIEVLGFVQPERLPEVFETHDCLLLPSRFEPWGVVVHEATSAGLAVICSDACGAGDDLVEPGVNGFVIPAGDVDALAAGMIEQARKSDADRAKASDASHRLSRHFTPRRWADRIRDLASEP